MNRSLAEGQRNELTEPEAINRARSGEAEAFEYLYRTYNRRVYAICLRMLKNASDAEDLTQQVFLVLFRKIGTFRGDSCFSTWLHRVAVNCVLMYLRRRKPVDALASSSDDPGPAEDAPREFGSVDTAMLSALDRLNLLRAIRKLAPGHRRLFLLHDVIGYKHNEIASLLGCSTGCSKSQVHRARKRLRQLLQGEPGQAEQSLASA